MVYKLINKETNEVTICDKVVIDDFEYYVIEEEIFKDEECYFITEFGVIFHKGKNDIIIVHPDTKKPHRKIVMTNNANFSLFSNFELMKKDYNFTKLELIKFMKRFKEDCDLFSNTEFRKKYGSTLTYTQMQEKWFEENL